MRERERERHVNFIGANSRALTGSLKSKYSQSVSQSVKTYSSYRASIAVQPESAAVQLNPECRVVLDQTGTVMSTATRTRNTRKQTINEVNKNSETRSSPFMRICFFCDGCRAV